MLQPRQLERVAQRFPGPIETLRTFLEDSFQDTAAAQRHNERTLAAVAARLRFDVAFRRDLGLSQVLHFVLAHVSTCGQKAVPATLTAGRARWVWPLALACLSICAVFLIVHLRHGHVVQQPQLPQAATPATLGSPPASPAVEPVEDAPITTSSTPVATVPTQRPAPWHLSAPLAHSAAAPPSLVSTTPAPSAETSSAVSTAPARPAEVATRSQTVPASPAAQPRTLGKDNTQPGAPVATPAAVLSQRLDARTMPTTDRAIDPVSGRAYPRLWRRHPAGPATPDAGILLADNAAPTQPGAFTATTATSSAGTVRPVSLGMMAANILYSPAPAYPTAAAVAHVQGQVRIQAEVDRDGSVASARVVSGPPLLRDAALDAVLRWRYRPRTLAGKPITAADTALLEFELP